MPISPKDVDKKREAQEAHLVEYHFTKIDEMLVDGERTYSCDELSEWVMVRIITAYERAGWSVERIYDQRDGNFLKFSAKKGPR